MSYLSTLFEKRRATATPDDSRMWEMLNLGASTGAGVSVSEESSLRYSAVFACVRVLSETVAQLPLHVYQRLPQGKERASNYPLYRLLHDEPNPLMTSFEFREALQGHLALWGNAYCEIEYNGAGRVVALWPLRPDMMQEVRRNADDTLSYLYQLPDGKQVLLPGWQVWHIRGLSPDGITGYSPIGLARQAIGLGLAAEEFGARFFGNDARPGGVLQHPGVLGDDAAQRLARSWESRHGGLARSHRVAILEEGMTYQQIGVPPEDAQFLETRKFQRSEIAGLFRVPPHLIGDLERATFSNIEHQSIQFVEYTMMPWLVRWEQAINLRLIPPKEQKKYYAEFLVDGLKRGDLGSRYTAYAVARQNGWMSANDIRELENMNPVDGGDVYLVPLNMVPANMVGEPSEPDADDGRQTTASEEQPAAPVDTARHKRVMLANGAEIRAEQMSAAVERNKLQRLYLPLWEDAAARLVRREANDVWNASRRLMKGEDGQAALRQWLNEFYDEFQAVAEKGYEPLMNAYSAQVAELASKEAGGVSPALAGFVAAYLAELASRHAYLDRDALLKALTEEEALGAIEKLLTDWRVTKPARIARFESVRASNAVAQAVYKSLGGSRKTWVTFGENCPYCTTLGGRTISMDSFFLGRGQEFQPEGAAEGLKPSYDIGHAPAHEGCDCQVVLG